MRTNDPVRDFDRYDAEQQKWLDRLPRCIYCDQPIQEEKAYCIDDEWWHEDCFNDQYLKTVDDY